ncbi:MAG TPA: hypothetical protein VKQ32_27835 [Polyangia bacterium]|nr:hypothetical protein [Polyangia bacterium]
MTRRPRLRKAGRIAGYAAAGLVALALVIAVGAPIYFQGERFGKLVEGLMPETRGHIHVGGGRWSWGTVIALVREQPAPLAVDDLTITDPEGTEVLHIEQVSARIEVRRRPTRITIHDLVIKDARWRFATMKESKKIGFVAAFEGVPHAARKPSKPSSTELSIEGARLDGIDVTFDLPTWGLVLHDAHAIGAIGFKAKTFTFEVKDVDVRAGGELRILGRTKGVVWPFERGRIDRVATTADAPDNIRLDASGVVNGASRTAGGGVFSGIYGLSPASKHPGIDLEAHMADAADAVNAIIARRGLADRVKVGGAGADLRLRFTQPFDQIAIEAELRGFDVTSGEIEARRVGCRLTTEPMAGLVRLERLSLASPARGHVDVQATLDRLQLDATIDAAHFDARPLLPSSLRPFAGATLDGLLHARVDLLGGDAELVRSTLVITPAESEDGGGAVALVAGKSVKPPAGATVVRLTGARLVDGVLRIPRLALSMWGGTFAAEGRVALWNPEERHWLLPARLDLKVQGSGLQIERLIGSGFARGALSFRARVHGTTDELALDMTFVDPRVITVLGEAVRLPTTAELHLDHSTIELGNLPLGGPGDSALIASGRIGLSGRLALDVGVVRYPIARLPGLSSTSLPVGGSISGGVRIVGKPTAPSLAGQFTLAGVTFARTSLGGGTIEITPERNGAVRARGHLADAIAIDGRLAPKASGLEGELTLMLTRLPLQPFLPPLPQGLAMTGFVSGAGVARIAPGTPVTAEAKLSELTLSLSSLDPRGKPAASIELHADNEIVARARGGDGFSLSPARFRSGAGWIELAGESHDDGQHATLRGHLELGAAAPFARRWFKGLTGSVEVDLSADARGEASDVAVSGAISVATPVSMKLAALPIEASIPSGRLRLTKNVLDTSGLPVVLHAERFPTPAVSRLNASARLSGRIDGSDKRGRFGARVALDSLDVSVPLVGRKPVHAAGGEIDVAGEAGTGKLEVTRIDLPITAEADGLTAAPGAVVDRATVAVRVRGDQRQLAVSGDVDVGSAHVRADALKKSKGAGAGAGGKAGPLAGHPEIEGARLDIRLRSHGGAIYVDVNNLPDLRVDIDMHVGGTVKKPALTGTQHGANVWSSFVLALVRLFT